MLDSALFITVLVIFATTILAAIIAARQRDPCLRQWRGYSVRLDLLSGEQFEGRIRTEISGLEFAFPEPVGGDAVAPISEDGSHSRHSYLIYRDEYDRIRRLVRFLDMLSPDEAHRRDKALRHAYRPGLHRRLARSARNWLNTLKDAVADAASTVAGHAGMKAQAGRAQTTGAAVIGAVGRAYDPLLERLIGHHVVVALHDVAAHDADGSSEYRGLFREYSSLFLAIVDVELSDAGKQRPADLILPRSHATVRFAAEPPRA
ncbi:MAG TPA: hypothetical protein QGF05_00200 [Dehalococcoidia bacterium]|nr:hypothetical protein [Dehalococcoidia bacterium]